jgi:peptidoglycan L-alanyl-D-glutamate endopeptidase CwlK
MTFKFSQRSENNLEGVHPDLILVMRQAIQATDIDFAIIEGVRTLERQREMVIIKASHTLNSRHLTGHAVDVAPVYNGKISWDWPLYYILADCIKNAAKLVDVPIEWGGDWKRFKDGPHWQLPWTEYPK